MDNNEFKKAKAHIIVEIIAYVPNSVVIKPIMKKQPAISAPYHLIPVKSFLLKLKKPKTTKTIKKSIPMETLILPTATADKQVQSLAGPCATPRFIPLIRQSAKYNPMQKFLTPVKEVACVRNLFQLVNKNKKI